MTAPVPSESGPGAAPGTYVLLLRCEAPTERLVGRLGPIGLSQGYYAYVGSAFGPGGVRARVARHRRTDKRPHWHLDYLRASLEPVGLWFSHAPERLEHAWASALREQPRLADVPGFGCSDCACRSHLFQAFGEATVRDAVRRAAVGAAYRGFGSPTLTEIDPAP